MSKESKILAKPKSKEPLTSVSKSPVKVNGGADQPHDLAELKQIQKELEQSISLLTATLESVADGIVVVDLAGRTTAFNQNFVQMWHIPDSIMSNTQERLLFLADQLKDPDEFLQRAAELSNQPEAEGHDILELKDGRIFERHSKPQWLGDKVIGRVWNFRDITQQKRAEEALQQREEQYRYLVETSQDLIWSTDAEGRWTFVNQAAKQIYGYEPDEIVGRPFTDFGTPQQMRKDTGVFQRILAGDSIFQYETEHIRKDGTPVSLSFNAIVLRDDEGNIVGTTGTATNITERKRAEELLRRNEETMAAAQRIAHVGNWVTDIPTNSLYWSDEIYRIFGLAPQEFDATVDAFFARVHPEDLDYVLKAVDDAMAGRKAYNVDHRIVRPSGEIRFVHQEAEVTFDENGTPLRMLGIVQDVTERRQLEQQVQRSLERRSDQVQLSAQVAQEIAVATNLDNLYQRIVTWINERFDFYHTQLLRYYPDTENLILVASYSETGDQILAKGLHVGLDEGLIGLAAVTGISILKPEVSADPEWHTHPLLPYTQGELAIPITLGGEDPQIQIAALQHFIKANFDGFVVTPLDSTAVIPVTHKAVHTGKFVVAVGSDLGEQNQTALIASSEREMGHLLGQQAGKWAKEHFPPNETIKIGMLVYAEPIGQIIEREKAIVEGIKEVFGDTFIIVRKEVESSPAQGLLEWLKIHPNMKMIIGITDGLALDAYEAVIAAGKNDPTNFFIGGVDAISEALIAIKEAGAYQATVTQSPRQMGITAIRTLVAAIKGLSYKKVNPVKHVLVNLSNVDQFLNKDYQVVGFDTVAEDVLTGLDLSEIKVGFSVLNLTNPFFVALVNGAREEAERLGIQLVVNDPKRVLGVLDIQSSIAGSLNVEDQLVLEGLCAQIAAAIESTRLHQEMEDRLHELNALQRLMSHEGWQAFRAAREQTTQAYLFDQTSVRATTADELWLTHNGTTQKELINTTAGYNGHVITKPMTVRGEIIGTLGIQNNTDGPLPPEDQAFLDAIAEQVAEALERARLLEQMQQRAAEMETVAQVSTVTSTILDTDKLLQKVADLTKERFDLYHAHIYLLNETGDMLNLAAGAGEIGQRMVAQKWSIPIAREHSLVAQAARTRQPVVVDDIRKNPDFMPNPLLPETLSEMAVPLIIGDNVLGVLDVQANIVNRFTDADVQVKTTLAAQVAVALRNASLYQQTQAALADLQQSQELLRTTIDATPDWIFIKDRNHRYRLVNQGYASSLHTTPENLIGKNDLEAGFPEDIVKGNPEKGIHGFWPDDNEVMESGKSKFIDVEPAVVEGQQVFLSTIKIPLRDSEGNVWGVLGFVRDITQREQLLAETENLYKTSRRLNEARDLQDLVAVVAEGGPVSVINRAGLLEFEYNSSDEVEAMVSVANWFSGQGTPPPPVGFRVEHSIFTSTGMFHSSEPIFFDDAQHDERMDPASLAFIERANMRALAVLPLQAGARQWGILILDGEEPYHFTEREMQPYIALARQLAVTLENRRLLAETQAALAEVERTQRRYTVQAWEAYQNRITNLSYEQVREGVTPLGDALLPEIAQIIAKQQQLIASSSTDSAEISQPQIITNIQSRESSEQQPGGGSSLIVPLTVRGETIGVLGLQEMEGQRKWLPEEIALIEAISEQLAQAAENIRLIDETQQRAARERRVNEISEKIQAAQSLEEALQIAVKEVGLSLKAPQTVVELGIK